MREMKMIDLETARGMTKCRLIVELGKCVNYLRKECFDQEKSK